MFDKSRKSKTKAISSPKISLKDKKSTKLKFYQYYGFQAVILLLASTIILTYLISPIVSVPNISRKVGDISPKDVKAPKNFQVEDKSTTITRQQEAEAKVLAVDDNKGAVGINVSISISGEMLKQSSPDDLVFIYAKAMSGPPMPLAALRKQVKDLPISVTLNDDMAMMPNLKLSGFSEVVVGARVSKSGRPIAENGDLFAEKASIKAGDDVSLEINSVLSK